MGTNNKTEEQMTDVLLRNYVKQQRQPDSICREFDPDIANAYLERVLTELETARYESHLSDCGFCRKSIVALAQLAEVEVPLADAATAANAAAAPPISAAAQIMQPKSDELSLMNRLKSWF